MSESQTNLPGAVSGPRLPIYSAEALVSLIVTLMTPMFLSAAGGDLAFARQAAAETLESYRADTHADLITVAKIIAFGLATISSLCLSMADDMPVTQILRLRSNANALDRSEHRNRLALTASRSVQQAAASSEPEPDFDAAALTAVAMAMQQRTAENLANIVRAAPEPPAPAPVAPNPTQPAAVVSNAEKRYQATWAASAATIAAETAASLPTMSPHERHSAAIWVDALNDAAKAFMEGDIPPRPRPGDFAAIMRP
jgi:hypothetical protein